MDCAGRYLFHGSQAAGGRYFLLNGADFTNP